MSQLLENYEISANDSDFDISLTNPSYQIKKETQIVNDEKF